MPQRNAVVYAYVTALVILSFIVGNKTSQRVREDERVPSRANAAFVILARNSELYGLLQSISDIEDRFNKPRQYPYVILNEDNSSAEFKQHITALTRAPVYFGKIAPEDWNEPTWIDQSRAEAERRTARYVYGQSQSYRRMCHYQSVGFYNHPLMQPYDYYWRVEPDVRYFCDFDYDPFLFMQRNNKSYGWNMAFYEFRDTIPTLWQETQNFMHDNPNLIAKNNALDYISDDGGATYNTCHFWSNLEIASLKWLRSEGYTKYVQHLSRAGGFFYERWGDAPVHTIAAAILLDKNQIHRFADIGYQHSDKINCPADSAQRGCRCESAKSWERRFKECDLNWYRLGLVEANVTQDVRL